MDFRRVDAREPNLVLSVVFIQHDQRIAVVDADHAPRQDSRLGYFDAVRRQIREIIVT